MRTRSLGMAVAVMLAGLVGACGDDDAASAPPDAGAAMDAGETADAGTMADARVTTDGSATTDAGATADARVTIDTGVAADASNDAAISDAGAADAMITRPACGTTAPRVLIYGPAGELERGYLPTGATVTTADDATWRAMTTAQFASYNLIVVGDNGDSGTPAWALAALEATRSRWLPAVTGRVVVLGIDPGYHAAALGVPSAVLFTTTALAWASSGNGTGLYVSVGGGYDVMFDYLSTFGTFTMVDGVGDSVAVTMPAHPILARSSSASLSGWFYSYHASMRTWPATFTSLAAVAGSLDGGGTPDSVLLVREADCP